MYSALQLPSLLSLQFIFDSDGPSTVMPSPPIPAPLERVCEQSMPEFILKKLHKLSQLVNLTQPMWQYLLGREFLRQFISSLYIDSLDSLFHAHPSTVFPVYCIGYNNEYNIGMHFKVLSLCSITDLQSYPFGVNIIGMS